MINGPKYSKSMYNFVASNKYVYINLYWMIFKKVVVFNKKFCI